ncbi:cadherin EGF LAG seven-pass G-type receptor 1-like isoform X2 [Pocillopora verrucosa]|uniref:cadherin EGF LAG seven-pass G-type receptor 1-like isoform X2 n=1 Tax=Pocillopora verrucosa TaxID=203993 RepID=UPI003342A10C
MGNTCAYKPCERGTCFNILGSRRCDCPTGFDGSRCETGVKYTERFSGQSFKRVPANSRVNLPWSVSMRFRTAKPSGTLLETSFSSSSSVPELVDGKLSYNYKGLLVLQLPHIAVNDTQWHHIEILWTDSSLNITMDYIYKVSADVSSGKDLEVVRQFFMGARKNSTKSAVYGGFRGCIQGVFVGSTEINMNSGVNHKTASGCEEKMGSHCSSNPCPDFSTCQEEFDSYKCICPVCYVGKHCLRVCSLKPCRHGKCESTNHGKGFRCVCHQQYNAAGCRQMEHLSGRLRFRSSSLSRSTLVFIMALFTSLQKQSRKGRRRHHHHHHDDEQSNLTAGLRATAGLLPLIGVSFAFAILMVNEDLETFHYVFAAFTFSQGLFIQVFYLLLDKTVRKEFKNVYMHWKTKDKTYGIQKPTQHFVYKIYLNTHPRSKKRPPLRRNGNTIGDEDTSAPDGKSPKAKYPDNPELERGESMKCFGDNFGGKSRNFEHFVKVSRIG